MMIARVILPLLTVAFGSASPALAADNARNYCYVAPQIVTVADHQVRSPSVLLPCP